MSEADTGQDKSIPVFPQLRRVVASHREFERESWKSREIYDVNCKKTIFRDCDFSYSEFDLGYFHSAEFRDCKFVGARFNNCNFQSAKFFACDFSWAQFSKCQISVKEILATLPSSPNIRQDVLRSLKANAIEMCDREGQFARAGDQTASETLKMASWTAAEIIDKSASSSARRRSEEWGTYSSELDKRRICAPQPDNFASNRSKPRSK